MEKKNLIREKSYSFALKIVKLYRLMADQRELILCRQILRSGTSIGANIEEALQGQSKKDFVAKLSISLKEAFETYYWLRLIRDSKLVETNGFVEQLVRDAEEILKILTSIIKTSKEKAKAGL